MKSLLLIFSLVLCNGLYGQKPNLNQSRWHLSDKIETTDYQYIKKAGIYCFISNDNENIYINLKVEDPGIQNRILKEGLTVWINMDDKSVKKMGLRFPIGSRNPVVLSRTARSESEINQDESLVGPLSMANTIELIGFITEEARHLPADNPDSFRGSVKYNKEGLFYYKMVLPISKLPVRNSKDRNGAMPFTLGIEYGSLSVIKKDGESMGPRSSSSFSTTGRGGGASGGGRQGSRGRSGGSGRISGAGTGAGLYSNPYGIEPVLQWIKGIKLATSK
jgi:hypothetical protein